MIEKYRLRKNSPSVVSTNRFLVRRQARPFQRQAGEETPGAGIGVDLGSEPKIGSCFDRPSDRTGGDARIAAEGELTSEQRAGASLGHEEQEQIGDFGANLKAETGTRKADEGRWVTKGVLPDSMKGYRGDHVDLFVRYMWQFTEQEGALMKSRN